MRSAERAHTLRALLRKIARSLAAAHVSYGHGTTNARDEAAWLALHALRLPLDDLEPYLDRKLTKAETRRVEALVETRIRTRKPTAYLTHEAWLGEHRFYVDERVIVPRSYIAELLRDDLAPWRDPARDVGSALDLCTGSGCLAVMLALTFGRAKVDASDVSSDALAVARRNVSAYRLTRRVKLLKSDLYAKLDARQYDLIVSNPPYVSSRVMRTLPDEYRKEPAIALAGGRDGLNLVRIILERAPDHLKPGGLLVVEVGHNRRHVERAYPHVPFVWPQTSGGDDCVFVITREALVQAFPAHAPQASRAAALPRPRGAGSPDRASGAAAGKRRRSARASGGSR